MTGCCSTDYRRLFNRGYAARDLRRFRRRGLVDTERDLVELCGDVDGATVLEAGGGIGGLQLELLRAGAAHATNVELSSGYEDAAAELLAGRDVDRRLGDFVTEEVEPHDVVVMHRVVCCYPDPEALVGAAAGRARRRLALTYPQERAWIRAGLGLVNVWLRLSRCGFRTYAHPVERFDAVAAAHGLRLERRIRRGLIWESAAYGRSA
jgi:magnesium-protoporphyrin O-methyltransferase